MTDTVLRDRLLRSIDAARDREAALLALCDDPTPAPPGRWTAKDNVAHLSAWREYAVRVLDAVRAGDVEVEELDDIDATNARILAERRHLPAQAVRDAAALSYARLLEAIGACDDAQLLRPRPGSGAPTWRVVPGNGHVHVSQHLSYWYAEHDDPVAAEDAAVWAHDAEIELFPDDESRATADYNLGCFYARTGRAAEALPLLQEAMGRRPDLRQWAAQDVDLDPIRSLESVQSLITG